jgi:glycosyltransferase involved in cell wall biosynthesis
VASVLNQTYRNLECIIVDDASVDDTPKYVMSIHDARVIYVQISKEESRGGNYARNVGINKSTGKYVAFLDDDDFWIETKLKKQIDEMKSNDNIGLVYCGRIIYIDEEFAFSQLPDPQFKGNLSTKVFEKIFCTTSAICIKKEVLIKAGGFDEKLAFWQEYDLLIRVCQITDVSFVNEALMVFRNNFKDKNRLSNKYDDWKVATQTIYQKYNSRIEDLPIETKKAMRLVYLENASSRCYITGRKKEQRRILREIYTINRSKTNLIKYIFNLSSQQVIYIKHKLRKFSYEDIDTLEKMLKE